MYSRRRTKQHGFLCSFCLMHRNGGSACLLMLLLLLQLAPSYSLLAGHKAPNHSDTTTASAYLNQASLSIASLDKHWLSDSNDPVGWTGTHAWQRFVIADALMQYTQQSGDSSHMREIERAIANRGGLDGNDDDLWAVIASLNLYRLNGSPRFLRFAQAKFGQITNNYWDGTCGGGLWWDHARTYKNAITNELLLYAAAALYQETRNPSYSIWAHKEWGWFNNSGLINKDNLVNDGLDKQCRNNDETPYTYNQGVILGGLVKLYEIDKEKHFIDKATALATASVAALSVNGGVLREPAPRLSQDAQIFKGIYVYHLAHLVSRIDDSKTRQPLSGFILHNADEVWSHRKNLGDKINAYWDNSQVLYSAAAQAAGVDLFIAAFETSHP